MERIKYQDIPKGIPEKLMSVEDMINQSGLDKQLLELLRLRVAQINHCAYCIDMHYKELKHLGESELRLSGLSVWSETPYFSDKEQAVFAFAEELTRLGPEGLSDAAYQEVANHFDKSEICWLSLGVAQINTWTRLMRAFKFTPGKYQVKVS